MTVMLCQVKGHYFLMTKIRILELEARAANALKLISSRRMISQQFYDSYMSTDFAPIAAAHHVLKTVHDSTGAPWWASIALTTIMARSITTFPFMVYSYYVMAKVQLLQPEIGEISKKLHADIVGLQKRLKWSAVVAKYHHRVNMKHQIRKLYIRDNCHPFKTIIVAYVQIPLWISMSLALRNMSGSVAYSGHKQPVTEPELLTEGCLWFTNLTLPDHLLILPLIICISNLAIIQMHSSNLQTASKGRRYVTRVFQGFSFLMLPIAAYMPSALSWYWVCSSLYGLSQNLLLKSPRIKRLLRIPKTPQESATPYRDIWSSLKFRTKSN